MAKPLKELLAQADQFMGNYKQASASISDEVSSLADTLQFAASIEQKFSPASNEPEETEFEKVAKSINIAAAKAELETMIQSNRFEKAALAEGFSKEQIDEALQKVAAKKVHQNLGLLATIGGLAPGKEDLNSLDTKKQKEVGEEKRRFPATHSLGGAR
jgi:biopolymer transport protein ExbB/TolQ